MKEITDAYYLLGGLNEDGEFETPQLKNMGGEKVAPFLIRCKVCNKGLCKLMVIAKSPHSKQNYIFVEPCPRCLAAARNDMDVTPLKVNGDWQTRKSDETQESIDRMVNERTAD